MTSTQTPRPPRMMIVGAFPSAGTRIFGGVITSCRLLLQSSLPLRVDLSLIDSTQISNPPPGLIRRGVLAIARVLRYWMAFERRRPHAVLLFCSAGASIFEKGMMAWYARLRGVPALLFPRGGSLMNHGHRALGRMWLRAICGGAAMILCQGPAWQRFATSILAFPTTRCPVIPNWSATPKLLDVGQRRVRNDERPLTLLFVGWVEREKGIQELLEAFRQLSSSRHVHLHIVGDGHAMPFVREFVAVNALQSRVLLSGWLSGEDLLSAYRAADVFVLPSWAEGLPNAMIEAMAAGLAVVVTRVGNVPDVVHDQHEGLLIPPRDLSALVNALEAVTDDPELRSSLSAGGHALATREFAVEAAVERIVQAMQCVGVDAPASADSAREANRCAE